MRNLATFVDFLSALFICTDFTPAPIKDAFVKIQCLYDFPWVQMLCQKWDSISESYLCLKKSTMTENGGVMLFRILTRLVVGLADVHQMQLAKELMPHREIQMARQTEAVKQQQSDLRGDTVWQRDVLGGVMSRDERLQRKRRLNRGYKASHGHVETYRCIKYCNALLHDADTLTNRWKLSVHSICKLGLYNTNTSKITFFPTVHQLFTMTVTFVFHATLFM